MLNWYLFQSKSRKEDHLCEQLRLRGIEIFFPSIRVKPVNPRSRKIKPYFPGYVFGRVDLSEVGRSILDWIPGG
jgi:transcription antitermination factor NusG